MFLMKEKSIQIRVSESEKSEITQKANEAGLSTSNYIRAIALKDDSLKILANGQDAAAAMIELQVEIQQAVRADKIPGNLATEFLKKLEDLSKTFAEILNQTDDISFGEEEE